jgi:hypothetical protein
MPNVVEEKVRNVLKYLLWKNHAISTPAKHDLIDQVIGFAYLTKLFVDELVKIAGTDYKLLAHFHEWMAGLPILDIKKRAASCKKQYLLPMPHNLAATWLLIRPYFIHIFRFSGGKMKPENLV